MAVTKKQTVKISYYGNPINTDIEMSFADGMIGVLPVFETREAAEKYAKGLEVVEVVEVEANQ